MIGILDREDYKIVKPLDKGLSSDKKYYIETVDGQRLLIRLNDIAEYDRKKTMFEMMKRAAALGVHMPQPVEFGVCDDGKSVYQLLTWCDGEDAEAVLPKLPEAEQYKLGLKSGEILRKIHSISAPDNLEDWSFRYIEVNGDRIKAFNKCGVQIEGSECILRYFEENKHLLNGRPQCFHHGDYHNGNFLITDKHDLFVIDWELLDYGNFADPWEEFNRIGNSEIIPHFVTGQLHGYFGGEPPAEFWRLLALYLSAGALMLVTWAFYMQQNELEYSIQNANNVLRWFDNMNNPVPAWYLKDLYNV
jgi:aminoglycoside phosphotransferase (APT) family kinase protein